MKILLYICSGVSLGLGIYELTWIGKSNITREIRNKEIV